MASESELHALVVRLEADTKNFRSEMLASQKNVEKTAKDISSSLTDMGKKGEKSFLDLGRIMDTALGFGLTRLAEGALSIATDAFRGLFDTFIRDGITAAQKQEDAINALNTQMTLAGNYSKEASADMQAFASQLQQTTTVGDETTLSMLALATTFGKSNSETKRLTQAAIELSAATGMSLEGAIKNLGKTYSGLTGELGESLPIVKTLTVEQLKAGAAVDLLLNKFGGSAAAKTKTFSGAMLQAKNTFGDFTETIGSLITSSPAVIAAINEFQKLFTSLDGVLKDNAVAFRQLVKDGMIAIAEAAPIAVDGIAKVVDTFSELKKAYFAIKGALATPLFGDDEFIKQQEEIQKAAEKAFIEETEIQAKRAESLDNLKKKVQDFSDSFVEAVEKTSVANAAAIQNQDKQTEAINKTTDAQQKLIEKQAEAGLALSEKLADGTRSLEQQLQIDQDLISQAENKKLLTAQQAYEAKLALGEKFKEDRKKQVEDEVQKELAIRMAGARAVSGIFGNLAQTAKAFGREGFETFKALATAQALVDTYASGVAAFKSAVGIPIVGPALAPVAAAAAVAAGLANVANIQSQTLALQKGGEIPGIGFGDKVPVMAEPGENMVDRSTNRKLNSFLDGRSDRNIAPLLSQLITEVKNLKLMVNVQVGGKSIVETVNEEIRGGRRLVNV